MCPWLNFLLFKSMELEGYRDRYLEDWVNVTITSKDSSYGNATRCFFISHNYGLSKSENGLTVNFTSNFGENCFFFRKKAAFFIPLFSGCMVMAVLIYIPVTAVFTYFSAVFIQCLSAFNAENDALCAAMSEPISVEPKQSENSLPNQPPSTKSMVASTEVFVPKLKTLRIHHEDLNDAYDVLQETFGSKMLMDLLTNLFSLFSVIAWFTLWSVNKWLATFITGAWHTISLVIYLGTIWMVANKPLALQHKVLYNNSHHPIFQ